MTTEPLTALSESEQTVSLIGIRNALLTAAVKGDPTQLTSVIEDVAETHGPAPVYISLYTAAAELLGDMPGRMEPDDFGHPDAASLIREIAGPLRLCEGGQFTLARFARALDRGTALLDLVPVDTGVDVVLDGLVLAAITVALLNLHAAYLLGDLIWEDAGAYEDLVGMGPLLVEVLNDELPTGLSEEDMADEVDAVSRYQRVLTDVVVDRWGADGQLAVWGDLTN